MKKIWKIRKDKEGVSPVIATILMVAITVVLAAVLYVMVMGIKPPDPSRTPLGLVQQERTQTSVSFLLASAPSTAQVEGTDVQINHDGTPTPVTNVTIYTASAMLAAWYDPITGWEYSTDFSSNDLDFEEGMTIVVYSGSISNGDEITLSNVGYFQTSSINVS